MDRRQFLATAGLALLAPRTTRAASSQIEILPEEKIGAISPFIYGHFTEHLGGCIYDGIWVGENSKIPNINGIRKELVDSLKRLKPPVIRWPGGCFADSYNWRDGVGPRDARPKRTNFWADTPYLAKGPNGPQKFEPNQFGSNEFAHFCQLVGAEPYFAGNVRSLEPFDFYQWIEYCNSPAGSTSLADLRAKGGATQPFPVKFWGVGNESWGCGGNFTGDEYAVEFRRYTEWVPRFGMNLAFIASGPNGGDYAWTHSFFEKMLEKNRNQLRRLYGCALHYYCGPNPKRQANDFSIEDWYKLLASATRMEELVTRHWGIMGEYDADRRVKLVVDEWGAWHETDPSIDPSYLWAYFPTQRDALISGLTLDIFNRHADKVVMANAAQLINNIHQSFLAIGDKFVTTPIYHVFEMYAAHQGGTSVKTEMMATRLADGLPGLAGSCSLHGNQAVLTVVNPDAQNPYETEINVRGSKVGNVVATVLDAPDIHARNTFDQPEAVKPRHENAAAATAPFVFRFAPASVTKLEFTLS